jgi:hypothetical protein
MLVRESADTGQLSIYLFLFLFEKRRHYMKKYAKHIPETAVILAALFTVLFVLAGCEGPLNGTKSTARAARQAEEEELPAATEIWDADEFNDIGRGLPAYDDYILMDDIELDNRDPVEFNGTFDGNGKTITLNSFVSGALAYPNLGIFTAVNTTSATVSPKAGVSNLTIEVNLDTQNPLTTSAAAIGMLAGSASGATFDNITVSPGPLLPGPLAIEATNGGLVEAGGIIGSMTKSAISDSSSALAIDATAIMGGLNTSSRFGGIAGAAVSGSTITNSVNTGAISLTTNGNTPCAGGIAGYTYDNATVELCKNTGNVTLIGLGTYVTPYSGGIVGRHTNASTIRKSYAACNVSTCADASVSQVTAGGIAGAMRNEQNNQTFISYITDCYFRGDVTVTVGGESTRNPAMAGGIVGFIYTGGTGNTQSGIVENCYATGNVSADSSNGAAAAGGIAGNLQEPNAAVKYSVALNDCVSIAYVSTGIWTGVHRVAGFVFYGNLVSNLAWANMSVFDNGARVTPVPSLNGEDGANTVNNPPEDWEYTALGWNFTSIWDMGGDDYPVLRNRL